MNAPPIGIRICAGASSARHGTHGPDDFLWAAQEGIALLNAVVLHKAETAFARPAQAIRFGGGGARSPRWAQIKADVTNRNCRNRGG